MTSPPCLLVTGGAGFIGSTFVLRAIEKGLARIVNLDKLTYAGNLENLAAFDGDPAHVFVRGDITDRPLVARLLAEHRPRAILHFAAESHVDRSIDSPAEFIQTNLVGTFQLLDAALAHVASLPRDEAERFRFIHVSTDEVYGSLGEAGAFTEESPFSPSSPYAASKAGADHLVRAYHRTYGLATISTHGSNNYGPRQLPEKLIPLTITRALEGRPLPIYGDGKHVRDWLYVGDHCDAIHRILDRGRPGESYNIGGACERENLAVVTRLCDLLDELSPRAAGSYRDLITFVADRPGHDRRYAVDTRKLQRDLGWSPARSFDEGLRETVHWYLDNRAWCERILRGEHQPDRLGLARITPAG
ncbi:dTDP-glucose 4,6-dehydratase [Minicystis rosea]|nr:dTDP-glucose 4,6-dehydratase [Minicystis rosea]